MTLTGKYLYTVHAMVCNGQGGASDEIHLLATDAESAIIAAREYVTSPRGQPGYRITEVISVQRGVEIHVT